MKRHSCMRQCRKVLSGSYTQRDNGTTVLRLTMEPPDTFIIVHVHTVHVV